MPLTRAAAAGLLLVSTIAALACTRRDAPPRAPQRETVAPPAPPPTPDSFLVALTTSRGPVTVVVRRSWAPHGADRFYTLVHDGFYDGARFFRVVRGFVVQFGLPADPRLGRAWSSHIISADPGRQPIATSTRCFCKAAHTSRARTRSSTRSGPRGSYANGGDSAPTEDGRRCRRVARGPGVAVVERGAGGRGCAGEPLPLRGAVVSVEGLTLAHCGRRPRPRSFSVRPFCQEFEPCPKARSASWPRWPRRTRPRPRRRNRTSAGSTTTPFLRSGKKMSSCATSSRR